MQERVTAAGLIYLCSYVFLVFFITLKATTAHLLANFVTIFLANAL